MDRTIRPDHPKLDLQVPSALNRFRASLFDRIPIIRENQLQKMVERALKLAGFEAEQLMHEIVPNNLARSQIPVPGAAARGFNSEAELVFTLAQRDRLLLDSGEHEVVRVSEEPKLIITRLFGANGIISPLGNRLGRFSQSQDRFSDAFLKV